MMRPVYAVDFETYYDKNMSIEALGLNQYARTTDIYLVAIVGPEVRYVCHPDEAPWFAIADGDWVSHNSGFDRACYRQQLIRSKLPLPEEPKNWFCTASLAVYLRAGRSLKEASLNLLGKEVSKDVREEMKGLSVAKMKLDLASEDLFGQAEGSFYEDVVTYALHDAELCWELWAKFGEQLPESERWLANHTYEMCAKGTPVNVSELEKAKGNLELVLFEALKKLPWCPNGETFSALSPKRLKLECLKNGIEAPISLAQDSDECEAWLDKYSERFPWVSAMRQIRRANIMLKKCMTILNRTDEKGRFNFGLKYYGAHTGRWSGDSGFNVQNMNKEPFEGVDLRKMFIAEPGHKLIIADFAQIEARVLPWLADDSALLEYIKKGVSVYEAHARLTMGYDNPMELKKFDKKLYALAKARVLALGFGCGADKFQAMAKLPMYGSMELSLDECHQIVADYRAKNPKTVALWKKLDSGIKKCVRSDYSVELPSRRVLTYFGVHYRPGAKGRSELVASKDRNKKTFERQYGGVLTENLVQAVARDIFANAIRNVVEAGYEVLFHVHDEIVVHAPVDTPKEEIELLMTTKLPDWAEDLPLGVESVESQEYRK
jgi:DNA polymerase I-like protein with 3'-5' exonuclease and polymerase domains